jgi:nucleoid-associated protein YgaU
MAVASYKGTDFIYGFKVLSVDRERDLKVFRYPNLNGAEHEDLGTMPLVFAVEVTIPGDAAAPNDRATLEALFEEDSPGPLYLPGRGLFLCYFRKFTDIAQAGSGGLLRAELEFVETLREDLTLERSPDELEDMAAADRELAALQTITAEPPSVFSTALATAQGIYDQVLDYTVTARQSVTSLTRRITEIQDAVERPYNELLRLSAVVEMTANQAASLYRSVIQYGDLPYTIARRLKNTKNILTSIARRFLPPPVDRAGRVIGEQYHGRTLVHRVVAGDTLQSVGLQYYGSGLVWECLAEANGIGDGNALAVGDLLVLPEFEGRPARKLEVKPGRTRLGHATCDT